MTSGKPDDPGTGSFSLDLEDSVVQEALDAVQRRMAREESEAPEPGEESDDEPDEGAAGSGQAGDSPLSSQDSPLSSQDSPLDSQPPGSEGPELEVDLEIPEPDRVPLPDIDDDDAVPASGPAARPEAQGEPAGPPEGPEPREPESGLPEPILERLRLLEEENEKLRTDLARHKRALARSRRKRIRQKERADKAEAAQKELEDQRHSLAQLVRGYRKRISRLDEEMQRVQRRASRDVEEARAYGAEDIIRELLTVRDDLERALGHAEIDPDVAENGSLLHGIQLVARQFERSLERVGVQSIGARPGHPFDPERHDAVYQVTSTGEDYSTGAIVEVLRTGYLLNGRLLRPSRVKVYAPEGESVGEPEGHDEHSIPQPVDDAGPSPGDPVPGDPGRVSEE